MEAITDREVLIRLDSNVEQLKNSIDRLGDVVTKLEDTKIKDHETRITVIEKWRNEFSGAYKVAIIMALILGTISTINNFFR